MTAAELQHRLAQPYDRTRWLDTLGRVLPCIGRLVSSILEARQTSPTADVSAPEREINDRVRRLCGLTRDEIKIVERSVTAYLTDKPKAGEDLWPKK